MPWPTEIASNLMIGCWTRTNQKELKIDTHELEDARWFSKEEIVHLLELQKDKTREKKPGEYVLPGSWTTAHRLMTHWVNQS